MTNPAVKTSKFLSLILRHKPETIGLTLDNEGWALISDILKNSDITLDLLVDAVENNNKNRFKISEDGKYIRASQGHSVDVDLKMKTTTPPHVLYHGTASKYLNSIFANGLKSGNRQHVHLSVDTKTAVAVGSRHGSPIVLEVQAKDMYNDGYSFFLSDNGVWLTNHVPVIYFKIISEMA